jgi:hypothetical protein
MRFYVSNGMTPTAGNAVASLGEVNMGNPSTLANFLVWAIQNYPADRHFLMIIGHGWIDGVCPDWTSEDILTPLEIRWALSQAKNATGVDVDVIGIEGCQQAALEIAYEMGDYADLIIASEEVSTHFPYRFILSDWVNACGTMNASSIASMIVDYYSMYSGLTGGTIMTLSAFNLTRVSSEVVAATTGLADILIANITRYAHAIAKAIGLTESHKPLYSEEEAASCRDLFDFALEIKRGIPDAPVQLAAQNLITAIENACVAEWHGIGHLGFHGLYVYLPNSEQVYDARTSIYGQTYSTAHPLWTENTNWDDLLSQLFETYGAGLRSRERITDFSFTPFDSNDDNYLDALQIMLTASTDGIPIDVVAVGSLIDPEGDVVDEDNSTWTVTDTGRPGNISLHMQNGGTEGLYSVEISLYDGHGIFENEILLQKIALLPEEIHHAVSVESINLTKTVVGQGYSVKIKVAVCNDGNVQEILDVTTHANGLPIDTTRLTVLKGSSTTLTVIWDTAGLDLGNYTVASFVEPIDLETNSTDNFLLCEQQICVTLPGDVDADRDIDILDVVEISRIYGSAEGQPEYEGNSDINGDGRVTILDVVIATGHYAEDS